jgi:hypothetical protein
MVAMAPSNPQFPRIGFAGNSSQRIKTAYVKGYDY